MFNIIFHFPSHVTYVNSNIEYHFLSHGNDANVILSINVSAATDVILVVASRRLNGRS